MDCRDIASAHQKDSSMTGKTVLITGANKSIGFETARQLGASGYRIWLGCRDKARGKAATERLSGEGHEVRCLLIDVTSDESVTAAAAMVGTEDGKLDVLINNAGISGGARTAPSHQTIDDIRTVYETNVFGPIRVTQAFLPLLKAAGRANIVMVSSGLGSLGWLSDPTNPFYGVNILGYNSSKSALNAVTVCFAKELASLGIKVNAADPGYTATDFNGHSGYRTVEQAASGIVWLAGLDDTGPTGGFYFEREQVPW
jgi:NAD(P)-dependent dehydrogenase (short-subunit alcohol dehydrogenase family)